MKELHGDQYETYRRQTPFLFPIPKWFKSIIKAPFRFLFKKEHPERKREIPSGKTVAALTEALKDEDFEVRMYAKEALKRIDEVNVMKPSKDNNK